MIHTLERLFPVHDAEWSDQGSAQTDLNLKLPLHFQASSAAPCHTSGNAILRLSSVARPLAGSLCCGREGMVPAEDPAVPWSSQCRLQPPSHFLLNPGAFAVFMDTRADSLLSPVSVEGFPLREGWLPFSSFKNGKANRTQPCVQCKEQETHHGATYLFYFFGFFSINPAESQIDPPNTSFVVTFIHLSVSH
ncbi:hypothetical protein H1C71_028488 [Ictidomys tridecemlineatus]|nr:hypothetical protein H1C71_028488 [Ictidomys tridecemlineatus]KAG3258802.1 hypothetical protein H1C71_028488 [Ictidomys tridecemlineatus]KAG3258803.1 hypothetical protein H1C71_028488 [Ictidomys tridecemlineatus]